MPEDPQVFHKVQEKDGNVAFVIHRSTNSNTVVYSARVKDGALDTSNPVDVYWIMYEKGGVREELNTIERNTAYGISTKPSATPGHFDVVVTPLKDKVIDFSIENGKPTARMTIGDTPNAKVERIWVESTTNMLGLPKVVHIDIYGYKEDGTPLHERRKS